MATAENLRISGAVLDVDQVGLLLERAERDARIVRRITAALASPLFTDVRVLQEIRTVMREEVR